MSGHTEQERFQRLVSHVPIGIFQMDPAGQMRFVNASWCETTGLSSVQAMGEGWLTAIHPEDRSRWSAAWLQPWTNPSLFTLESRCLQPSSQVVWTIGQLVAETDSSGHLTGYLGTLVDISQQKHMEEALQQAKVAAEAGLRSRSEFLTIMSHELRTPMNSMIGTLELFANTRLDGEQRRHVDTMRSSGLALLALLGDILELSGNDTDASQPLHGEWFELSQLLRSVVDLFEPATHDRPADQRLMVRIETFQLLYDHRFGDVQRLRVILTNLLGNAIRFTERGSVTLRVFPAPGQGSDTLRFVIADTGIGIPAEQHERIFLPFIQADSSVTRTYGGSGVGLAITKRFVEQMNGRIWLTSEPGHGSEFSFDIPLPSAKKATTRSTPVKPVAPIQGRVLLVEDDPVNRVLLISMLRKLELEPEYVTNGRDALKRLDRERFDLILMDCLMPVMDGFTTTRKIRQREEERDDGRRTPIVAFTALGLKGDRERCLAAGMDDYLSKPILIDDLTEVLQRWLGYESGPAQLKTEQPVFDPGILDTLRRTVGQEFATLLEAFLKIVPQRLKNIRKAIMRKEMTDVHMEAHALRISSRQLGLIPLADVAMEIDILSRIGKTKRLEKLLGHLEDEAQRAIRVLERERQIS
ncbi:MAG: response regulator [Magnetococcales bacterium]|nr:response regulator [Magnetococcales bacterium]